MNFKILFFSKNTSVFILYIAIVASLLHDSKKIADRRESVYSHSAVTARYMLSVVPVGRLAQHY